MTEEGNSDLIKSWVFVDSEKKSSEEQSLDTSGVEEVSENGSNHADSDTDSISVISESGCSYRTDEEEFVPTTTTVEEQPAANLPEIEEVAPPEPAEILQPPRENETVEKLLYFATSAVCAVILIAFSMFIQHYFNTSSDVNKFNFEQQGDLPVAPYVQSVKNQEDSAPKRGYGLKRRTPKGEETQFRFGKNPKGDGLHDRIMSPSAQIENNDLTVEDDVKSNYKPSKNKSPATKFNKENCDDSDKRMKNEDFNEIKLNDYDKVNDGKKYKKYDTLQKEKRSEKDGTISEKIKELKIKEAYLREKEKFLIEKEHDLLKKEIKLNSEKGHRTKYENKSKKDKDNKYNSKEFNSKEKKDKFKMSKKNYDAKTKNKKYNYKEEKKRFFEQKFIDESQQKKRNMSGYWYIDLHKARNSIRQKEHASDWVFDRARLRSLKRNKSHWYFQWMADRARLRVK